MQVEYYAQWLYNLNPNYLQLIPKEKSVIHTSVEWIFDLSPRSCPSIVTEVMLDLNFSVAPLNSDPSTFVLIFHNPGSLPADW